MLDQQPPHGDYQAATKRVSDLLKLWKTTPEGNPDRPRVTFLVCQSFFDAVTSPGIRQRPSVAKSIRDVLRNTERFCNLAGSQGGKMSADVDRALYFAALVHEQLGEYPAAARNYLELLKRNEKYPHPEMMPFAYLGIGITQEAAGEKEAARLAYRRCLELQQYSRSKRDPIWADVQARLEPLIVEARSREAEQVKAAITLCDNTDLVACKKACRDKDQFACVRLGKALYVKGTKNKDLESLRQAGALYRAVCAADVEYGCELERVDGKAISSLLGEADQSWSSVAEAIRDIATSQHSVKIARALGPGPKGRRARAAEVVQADVERKKREDYCPARREFIAKFGLEEFSKRAKEQCEGENAPADGADSGVPEQRRLWTDCNEVVATSCPASAGPGH
jgi:tetratricopeptide (TPR) repeat protein